MNNPFKQGGSISGGVPPSGSSAPERQQSQGKSELEAGPTATEQAAGVVVTAASKAAVMKQDKLSLAIQKQEVEKREFLEELKQLSDISSWSGLPLYMRVKMLMETPIKTRRDEPDKFLTGTQALGITLEIDALNRGAKDRPDLELSPRSADMWIDPETLKLNISVEGQRKIAGRRNDLGVPVKVVKTRPWPKFTPPEVKNAIPKHFTEDYGVECSIPVGNETVVREAWLSGGWFRPTKNWREQTEHMLGVRSEGLCYEAITGKGISQAHGNEDVEPPTPMIPSFTTEKV